MDSEKPEIFDEDLTGIFDSITIGIALIDMKGTILKVNKRLLEFGGYNKEEIVGKQISQLRMFPPEDISKILLAFTRLVSGQQPEAFEVEVYTSSGDKKTIEIQYSFLKEHGQTRGVITTLRDITKRKEAEVKLLESEMRYRTLFEKAGDAIFIMEAEGANAGRIIATNKAAADMHGYTIKELLSMNIKELDTIDAAKKVPERIRRMLDGEWISFEINHRKKDRSTFPVEVSAGIIIVQGHKYILAIDRDISERKEAEEKIRLLSSAMEAAPDGVQIVDLNGIIIHSNKAVRDIYGFSPGEYEGKHVDEMNADPEFTSKVILPSLSKTGQWTGELMVKHKNGTLFPIWLTTSLIKDDKGKPVTMVGIIRDISQQKKAEKELKKYSEKLEEANQLKTLFSDIIHHDLLNPLTVINGYVELLKETETTPRNKYYLTKIEHSLNNALELIESASTYSRLESYQHLELTIIDLQEIIRGTVEKLDPALSKAGMELENKINQPLLIKGNKIIEEVFHNILTNAIKYASEGKKIIIHSEETPRMQRIKITDFGPGIKDADKTGLFKRFQRNEKRGVKGTGLGLSISRKIIELHDGSISVEDNKPHGCTFIIELPRNQ